ncbi:MAG: amidohydrolase [Rhodoglobus sp.]|nr:amidohydrolase [Rhodoglobus sp.]
MTTVFTGRIRPFAPSTDIQVEAMAVDDASIVAIGSAEEVRRAHPDADVVALDGWVMPGLIEPHGHPGFASILLSDLVVDLRPVVVPQAEGVLAALRTAVAEADGEAVFANGWDSLLQRGLPDPDMHFLDELAGGVPLVVIHNSGHSVYFNTAAALAAGIDRTTPDPAGASFGRDADGELTGVALEAAAVEMVVAPMLAKAQEQLPRILPAHLRDLASRGITTVADLSWNPGLGPLIDGLRAKGEMPVRLRWYEMSRPGGIPSARGGDDPFFRQTGVKTWSDGSPWVGNIATSFPYLDTPATRALGLEPHHIGRANYTSDELSAIAEPYAGAGWQLACHAHGDLAIDATLDVFAQIIARHGLTDHRFRLEHCGAMTSVQFERAASLGVTVSLFVDHITYWGEVLVDDLFGPEHGGAWADAGAAFAAGHRVTFHNDGWVTPNEPFRNMAVAETRTTRNGYRMPGGTPVTRDQALLAHTANAAWQLFSEREVGVLAPGLFADFIVVDRDPVTVSAEDLAATQVTSTYLAGVRVV